MLFYFLICFLAFSVTFLLPFVFLDDVAFLAVEVLFDFDVEADALVLPTVG